jgi:hypothetical protein
MTEGSARPQLLRALSSELFIVAHVEDVLHTDYFHDSLQTTDYGKGLSVREALADNYSIQSNEICIARYSVYSSRRF